MKEELIKLAKEKGFDLVIYDIIDKSSNINIDIYYLWLCELQKWLRDEYKLSIEIMIVGVEWGVEINRIHLLDKKILNKQLFNKFEFKTYEQALEEGLYQALKLI